METTTQHDLALKIENESDLFAWFKQQVTNNGTNLGYAMTSAELEGEDKEVYSIFLYLFQNLPSLFSTVLKANDVLIITPRYLIGGIDAVDVSLLRHITVDEFGAMQPILDEWEKQTFPSSDLLPEGIERRSSSDLFTTGNDDDANISSGLLDDDDSLTDDDQGTNDDEFITNEEPC